MSPSLRQGLPYQCPRTGHPDSPNIQAASWYSTLWRIWTLDRGDREKKNVFICLTTLRHRQCHKTILGSDYRKICHTYLLKQGPFPVPTFLFKYPHSLTWEWKIKSRSHSTGCNPPRPIHEVHTSPRQPAHKEFTCEEILP